MRKRSYRHLGAVVSAALLASALSLAVPASALLGGALVAGPVEVSCRRAGARSVRSAAGAAAAADAVNLHVLSSRPPPLPSFAGLPFVHVCSSSSCCHLLSARADETNEIEVTDAFTSNVGGRASSLPPQPQPQPERSVTILEQTPTYLVAAKPPSVVCHHSGWTGSRSRAKRGEEPEIPMLQRVRDGMSSLQETNSRGGKREEEGGGAGAGPASNAERRRVNVVHRLDRGASGCLLFAFADDDEQDANNANNANNNCNGEEDDKENVEGDHLADPTNPTKSHKRSATAILQEAMASPDATKTYLALVRGEGILRGEDLKARGWFLVDREIKDEKGRLNNATTWFRFVAGQPYNEEQDLPRASLVLARPVTGRWHQVRRHLNGLSHPILGDTSHGASQTNREWKERRNMSGERTCLHLARMQLPPNEVAPDGIDVCCPLEEDMMEMMRVHMPKVLEEAESILREEGIRMRPDPSNDRVQVLPYKVPDLDLEKRRAVHELNQQKINILAQGPHHVVVEKPPTIVCHHSAWTGKRSEARRLLEPTPMLQRVRDLVGRRVNLVHRLDRGASGCLIFSYADEEKAADDDTVFDNDSTGATTALMQAMQSPEATKTYLALVNGDGFRDGEDLIRRGWFDVDEPVKDENGKPIGDSMTEMRFVASVQLTDKPAQDPAGKSSCLVLAKPKSGRWHQVRQHCMLMGHPILGDSTHGLSRTNRIWREKRGMLKERVCLHLTRVDLPPTEFTPDGIRASCPIPNDMKAMIENSMPSLLVGEAKHVLEDSGVIL